jgi:desulfoferrodoxin (superoxide reductase-like protein)
MKHALLGSLVVLALSTVALAHPPSSITLTYDLKNHILKADIMHNSRNIEKHFIAKVTVTLNGNQIVQQQFQSQFNNDEQQALYFIIDAKKGDEIAVTGACVIYGQITQKLKVSAD